MADFNAGAIIGMIVFIILLLALFPFIKSTISNSRNEYYCTDSDYKVQSADLQLCTNASYACLNAAKPILDPVYNLCTNASGVGVVNATPTSGFLVYNESSDYYGPSPMEFSLAALIGVVIIVGGLFIVIKTAGIGKSD